MMYSRVAENLVLHKRQSVSATRNITYIIQYSEFNGFSRRHSGQSDGSSSALWANQVALKPWLLRISQSSGSSSAYS